MSCDNYNLITSKEVVEKGIPDRIEVILESLGEKWADVYNDLGWNKSYASKVRRGLLIPPVFQRIKLAKRMRVDTSVIWKIPDLIPANELEDNE